MNPDLAIVVSSFDGMDDLWQPFWELFRRFWPDCPYDKYMISNHKICRIEGIEVRTIAVGDDQGWARNLRVALESIPHQYVIYLQEDYLLRAPVETARIKRIFELTREKQANLTYLFPRLHSSDVSPGQLVEIRELAGDGLYRINLQAALWKKSFFLETIRADESQWQFELRASDEPSRSIYFESLGALDKPESWSLPYFCTAIVRGKWVPDAMRLCERNSIAVDLRRRPAHRYWALRRLGAKVKWYWKWGFRKAYET